MSRRLDCSVEKDGCCRISETPRICWITPSSFSEALQQQTKPLVLDMRSFSAFNVKHVKTAHNLCFSPILIRRMLKNFISLDTLVTDPELFNSISVANSVVLYDANSKPGCVKQEFLKFSELLAARFPGITQRMLLGGINGFESRFPDHCTSTKAQSPIKNITFDLSKLERMERKEKAEGNPVEILPFLYLGSAKDSADVEALRQMGITAVLNITTTCPNFFESEFQYMCIQVEDSPQTDLHCRLQQAIEFIDEIKSKGGRVFVHCHAGISRSATVCIAYVMQSKRLSAHEAYSFVKSKRPIISPNLSFMGQLIQYQQELISKWATETRTKVTSDVIVTTTEASTTKSSTFPKQSLASDSATSLSLQPLHFQSSQYHAQESSKVSQLTDMLNCSSQLSRKLPPLLSGSERSISVPTNISPLRNVSKRKREELRLSLDLHNPARKSPQLSPCRVEVATLDGSLTQSLTLSTTCT